MMCPFSLVIPVSPSSAIIRPPGTNLMLEQQKEDTGSAISLITCFGVLMKKGMGLSLLRIVFQDS
jgi:DHA1 family bicyclomycin/chloramphenicol resistance-like MFS transporter